MPLINLPSRHDWSAQFGETESDLVVELGLDDARLPGAEVYFPDIEPITGVRLTLHTIDDEGNGEISVRLDLDSAEDFAEAILDLVRKQRRSTCPATRTEILSAAMSAARSAARSKAGESP